MECQKRCAAYREALAEKLKPGALAVSPKFHSILGYLVSETWTSPCLLSLSITSDGYLLGFTDGLVSVFLGNARDLARNLLGMRDEGIITDGEYGYLVERCVALGGTRSGMACQNGIDW